MANNALSESFDNGVGAISNAWNVDTSVRGQVTLRGNASMMEWASGREAGHGYGTYTVTARLDGNQPGPAIILWPGDNRWPGQEMDMAEITPDGSGRQYGAVHWNNNGSDAYTTRIFDGVSGGTFHDYQLVWEPGRVTFRVDGAEKGVVTNNVPVDFDNGGMNNTIGFLNNNPNTSITVSHVDFRPSSGGGGTAGSAPPVAEPAPAPSTPATPVSAAPTAPSGAIDWNALAAQVTANFQATGSWSAAPAPAQSGSAQQPASPAPAPAPAPAPTQPATPSGATDWNALAAQVTANFQATGSWSATPAQTGSAQQPASPAPAQPAAPAAPATSTPSGQTDWNALAAQLTANYDATGSWFI